VISDKYILIFTIELPDFYFTGEFPPQMSTMS